MASGSADLSIALLGDLILGEPDPDSFFDGARAVLQSKDLVIGHVEVPHTRRGRERGFDVPAETYDPERLLALGRAGVHVATLAGNHIDDFGAEGIRDTIDALRGAGIATTGAGLDLASATAPVHIERRGVRVGVLSFNCAGPRESWAAENKSGCAYVRVVSEDGSDALGPTAAQQRATLPDPASLRAFQFAIDWVAGEVDLVIVALHKGVVHTPAVLAGYERPIARAALEAGADIVVGHHAHILRGIEVVRGRPVFHGLGNFVTVTRALSLDNQHPARREWAKKRRELFGFTPDPEYPNYPFHPEAKHALIADCRIGADGHVSAGFLPCWIQPSGKPEVLGRDARGQATLDYVADISRRAGFATEFAWQGDRVVVG
jgi:poly-gamma-glutamate capsule biosynthesis protein CapA/YwtB (metallophosphatase superfamily)